MIITRPILPLTGKLSRAHLQALNDISVELEASDVISAAEEAGLPGQVNLFNNPTFSANSRQISVNLIVEEGTRAFWADWWFCRVRKHTALGGGAATTPIQATFLRNDDTVQATGQYKLNIGYFSGVEDEFGDIELGQQLSADRLAKLGGANGGIVTALIENGSNATFTPKARLYTNDAFEVDTAITAEETVSGVPVSGSVTLAPGERREFTFRFTTSGYLAALKRGGEICLVLPETADLWTWSGGAMRVYGIIKLEQGNVSTRAEAPPPVLEEPSQGDGTEAPEFLVNGDFASGRFVNGSGSVSCPVGDTPVAVGWEIGNSAGTVTVERDTTLPTGTGGGSALKITGHATATAAVVLRQQIFAEDAAGMLRDMMFQAQIRNGTGADLVVTMRVRTSASAPDDPTVITRVTETSGAIANGEWGRLVVSFDGASVTDLRNGAVVELSVPALALDNAAKTVRFAQVSLRPGVVAVDFQAEPRGASGPAFLTGVQNLKVDYATTDSFTVSGDGAVLADKRGVARRFPAFSFTVDAGGNGLLGLDTGTFALNTKYYLWLLGNDDGVTATLSTSGTAPDVSLDGYRWRYVASILRTKSGAIEWKPFFQRGRWVYVEAGARFTITPANTDWTSLNISSVSPTEAIAVAGTIAVETAADHVRAAIAGHSPGTAGPAWGMQAFVIANVAAYTPTGGYAIEAGTGFVIGVKDGGALWHSASIASTPTFSIGIGGYELP